MGDGAVWDFLGTDPDSRRDLDPPELGSPRRPGTIVHGEGDAIVPSVPAHRDADVHPGTEVVIVPRAGHFALIDPLSPAWPAVRSRLLEAS
ncbi:hypothetical protein GCM10023215_67010 [Pseudonocardia yuanmonensis]|uniref:TAP-like protein n=1 Tax=Pseudonocardia yuanmonensis TaxID=1095914 RepID=A0ABP8XTH7_9PSEU